MGKLTGEIDRRSFLGKCFASGVIGALGWDSFAKEPKPNEVFPGWHPGEMDLHFIYTGCGENMFYRLPDGTAIVNDVGEFFRPHDLKSVPLLPSEDRLGGDWVARYIKRIYSERTIDYAIFSHWHSDHIGHGYFDKKELPNCGLRYRVTADGRKIDGFLCVAEEFGIKRYLDHQYPRCGMYGQSDVSMKLLPPWVKEHVREGLLAESFRVGALNQIALQRNPEKYRDLFSIRNIAANGVLWDGGTGTRDFAAEHVAATGRNYIEENMLSMAFVIQYGKFRYFTGGDIQADVFVAKDGSQVNYEELVGKRVGRVNVCKMNHHGCRNAMTGGFLSSVLAQAYIACMWCPDQSHCETLGREASAAKAAGMGSPLILPNLVTAWHKKREGEFGYGLQDIGAVHVVVKVLPGGSDYRIYLLDARDESMRVRARFDMKA